MCTGQRMRMLKQPGGTGMFEDEVDQVGLAIVQKSGLNPRKFGSSTRVKATRTQATVSFAKPEDASIVTLHRGMIRRNSIRGFGIRCLR